MPRRLCARIVAASSGRRSSFAALSDAGQLGSMGLVGACANMAARESFFVYLYRNVLDPRGGLLTKRSD